MNSFQKHWQAVVERAEAVAARQSQRDPDSYSTRLAEILCINWLQCQHNAPPQIAFELQKFVESYAAAPKHEEEIRRLKEEIKTLRDELGRLKGERH